MHPVNLIIIEGNGWSKTVKLLKAITLVGSAGTCEIQLNSDQIAPVQAQILCSPDLPTGCRLVNLSTPLVMTTDGVAVAIDPFVSCDVHQQDELRVGDYRIQFELPLTTDRVQKTSSMEASLSFLNAVLRPEFTLEGKLVVKNLGSHEGTQFQVGLEGLPPDCYLIDPIPLLYPGAQEEIRVRLFHKRLYPQAGMQAIFIIVTAPDDYPGEELSLAQNIFVSPLFEQKLEVVDDIAEQQLLKKQKPALVETAQEERPSSHSEPIPANVITQGAIPDAAPWPPAPVLMADTEDAAPIQAAWNSPAPEETPSYISEPVFTQIEPEVISVKIPEMVMTAPAEQPEFTAPVQKVVRAEPVGVIEAVEEPVVPPQPAQPRMDRSRLKVVRHPSNDFWNEE